jgi:hypothetical protein
VNDRLNYFTPTIKPTGWSTDATGRRKRLYDQPATPFDRLLGAHVLSPEQETTLLARRASLDLGDIARQIERIQTQLVKLAAAKTRRLAEQAKPHLPDPSGIKLASKKP